MTKAEFKEKFQMFLEETGYEAVDFRIVVEKNGFSFQGKIVEDEDEY